jgi:hypothetical protein
MLRSPEGGNPLNTIEDEQDAAAGLLSMGFESTAASEYLGRNREGPLFNEAFLPELVKIDKGLKAIHPSLTPEYLASPSYYSPEVRANAWQLQEEYKAYEKLEELRKKRISGLVEVAREVTGPLLSRQQLEKGQLDEPPYIPQFNKGDALKDSDAAMSCAAACFRMVLADLSGYQVSRLAVFQALEMQFGSFLVDNFKYLNFYHSQALADATGRQITTVNIMGADFETLGKISNMTRRRQKYAKIYCVASVASTANAKSIVHQVILLDADKTNVYCHDPSPSSGAPRRRISKPDFAEKWAINYNHAMLIIAI